MPGIGEYVHLKQDNYKKFGIGRTEIRGMSFTQSYNQAKNELLMRVGATSTSLNLQDLEVQFNNMRTGLGKTSMGKNTDFLDQFFIEEINKYFENKNHKVNYETLDVQSAGTFLNEAKMLYNNKRQNNESAYFQSGTWNKFKQRFRKSITQLNQAYREGVISKDQSQELRKNLMKIKGIIKEIDQQISTNGIKSVGFQKMNNLFEQYNEIIAAYSLPSKKELGDLAEFAGLYMALRAGQISQQEIKKLFMEGFKNPVGMQGSKTTYDFSGIINQDDLDLPGFKYQENKDGRNFNASINTSQDTIDVAVAFKDDNFLASVKNVSHIGHPRGISLIKKVPLTALFNLVNTDFVNHYMNILGLSNQANYNKQINISNELWKKALVVRGLSGARTLNNTNLANVFMINERNGKIKLFSISELLNRMLRLTNQVETYVNIEGDKLPSSVKNEPVGNIQTNRSFDLAGQRIAKIFNDLHAIKLNASILPAALKR